MLNTAFYETELQVRPDDIDLFQHVHSSKYIDYVMAARFDQMGRCYGNPIASYLENGLGWVVSSCEIHYKRALKLGDSMIVKTSLQGANEKDVEVAFQIMNKQTGKLCCEGHFVYTLINLKTMRAETIPDWAMKAYTL